jgi:hypothetical protein
MNNNEHMTLVGVFVDRNDAQRAVNDLRRANFREDQIGVVTRTEHGIPSAEISSADTSTHSKIAEGTAVGAATGAGIGALWALGIAASVLPAVGPVIAGGTLMAVIASAAGAGAIGTIVGALIGLGIPEEEAKFYEGEFAAGRSLVTVKPEQRYAEARAILRNNGAYDMQANASGAYSAGLPDET